MTDRRRQNVRYWNDFCDELKSRGSQFQFPTYREAHYIEFGMGRKCGVAVRQVIKPKPGELSAVFYMRGSNAITFFDALMEQQAEIEEEFGESLKWWGEVHRGEQRLGLKKADVDPADETDWPNQHEWLATKLENSTRYSAHASWHSMPATGNPLKI